jgi:hypothetical protein
MSNIEKRGRILLHHKYPEELAPLSFFICVLFESKPGDFRGIVSGTDLVEEMRSGRIDMANSAGIIIER